MGLGSILKAASGGIINVGEKLYDNYASAKAATKAFDRDKWMMSNKYQMQVEDLRKSGLNPALAYSQVPTPLSAPMAQTSKGGVSRGVADLASAAQARAATLNLNADTELKAAQAETERNRPENIQADTGLKHADTALRDAQRQLADSQSRVARETVNEIISKVSLNVASADESRARTSVARATIPRILSEISNIDSRTAVNRVDTLIKGLDYEKQRQLLPYLVQLGIAESYSAQLSLPEREAMAAKWRSTVGQSVLPWAREVSDLIPGIGLIVTGGKGRRSGGKKGK